MTKSDTELNNSGAPNLEDIILNMLDAYELKDRA